VDPHGRQERAGGKEDPDPKQDFVELSLEPNSEGSSDLLRSPAGPDGQKRRNRTDTMIFSEAINIAEDLAKALPEGELEASTSFTEISLIGEVAEAPLIPEAIPLPDDATTVPSDPSLEFTDHIPTDEAEEIPLPAITDSEPGIPEDSGEESSDEETVPEEEIPDPTINEPPASEPSSTIATEASLSEGVSDERRPEPTDVSEPAQSIPETSEPPPKVEVPPTSEDEDESVEMDEEEPASASGPSELEAEDDGDDENDENGSQPADEPEVES
jgi:hypothetical protein